MLKDLGRLIAPLDVVYHVGKQVYRRSLRYTMFTVGVSVVGMLAKQFNLPGLTVRQAILLPLAIGGTTLVGGFALKTIPSLISSRLMIVAQAGDLNLMEDYRKAEMAEHLDALWDRVFRHECMLRVQAGEPAVGCAPADGEPMADTLGRAQAAFRQRAAWALQTPTAQIQQLHEVGLDLRYLEDWRDGAYLDASDTKLMEQFNGASSLLAARRAVRLGGWRLAWRFGGRVAAQRFWFAFLTRMTAIQVGSAVEHLNRRYDTDLFNCQVLLWPGQEDRPWLNAYPGARERVLRRRRRAVRRVFGPDRQTACCVLDHMLYVPYALATELRMRFDPGYCDGRLGYDVVADLEADGCSAGDLRRARRFAARARRRLEAFDALLRDHRPGLLAPAGGEALRAVRVVFHTDQGGLARRAAGGARWGADLADLVDRAADRCGVYTRWLIAVRMHHELTRLARRGYRKLIATLAYDA
jgi:hypothetical protein